MQQLYWKCQQVEQDISDLREQHRQIQAKYMHLYDQFCSSQFVLILFQKGNANGDSSNFEIGFKLHATL